METYFVITAGDGDTYIKQYTKDELLKALAEEYWGDNTVFLDLTHSMDPDYWPENGMLIIKGEIVAPTPKDVVTAWDIS